MANQIQLNDGNSFNKLYYSKNTLYSPLFKGDGGLLSNVGGLSTPGTSGEVLVYTSGMNVGGDAGFTYYQPLQMLSVGGTVNIGGDLIVSGNTYSEDTIVFNNPIIEIGKSAPINSTIGLLFTKPTGNVMLGMESNTLISSGSVQVFGNVTANNFLLTSSQVTLGLGAGIRQPPNSICIGTGANTNSISSIVISGNGPLINIPSNPGFYVSPIRVNPSSNVSNILTINTFSNEIVSTLITINPFGDIVANSISVNHLNIENFFKDLIISGEDFFGNIVGSNTISASTISGTHYGPIIGSNTISATTISAETIHGPIIGSNTISASTILAETIYGQFSGTVNTSSNISGANLFGNLVGSNTVSAASIIFTESLYGTTVDVSTISTKTLYSDTISATNLYGQFSGIVATNSSISGANLFGNIVGSNTISATTIYGEIIGSNTINASTISGQIIDSNTVNCNTIDASIIFGTLYTMSSKSNIDVNLC